MATRMLIDATHEEETRVVVVKGNRVEEFDFETAARKPLKGNIYLARVTRVEPSLQAAFVDFGGNRHGFLAFSEIHPDYYQIPVADRERLKQEEAEAAAAYDDEEDDEEEEEEEHGRGRVADTAEADDTVLEADVDTRGGETAAEPDVAAPTLTAPGQERQDKAWADAPGAQDDADPATAETEGDTTHAASPALPDRTGLRRVARLFGLGDAGQPEPSLPAEGEAPAAAAVPAMTDGGDEEIAVEAVDATDPAGTGHDGEALVEGEHGEHSAADPDDDVRATEEQDDTVESFGGDTVDEVRRRRSKRRPLTRRYKIQEVIKRRQILLVQVVKEERGNKGAALTTYMSLAGRYCVLMPNSPNGGGISRKIVSANDRKRLKAITSELDMPEGMGMIVRTAGMERTRAEIKRDFEFLLRTWDHIRELTLASMAPCLVYEEANLIKRSIRDLYAKEIDEVLVEGENGYRTAKDLMKMLMPSHSKRVQPYRDRIPLFHRYQIENQLDDMYNPTVQLKSGGYLVINSTEALVAIDVNSGRSTKEHNIEGTAYKTNMEAAEEVARQLRLRDLAGLIVIDFIDMDEARNNRNVERKLKECLKLDRARIQVGRISSFGLLEMSRQRLRPSLIEQSMVTCPHCDGQGHVRSIDSAALRAIRAAEDEGIRERSAEVTLVVPTKVAIYLLNSKRDVLEEIEGRYGIRVLVRNDDTLGPSEFGLERSKTRSDGEPAVPRVITAESVPYRESEEDLDETDAEAEAEAEAAADEAAEEEKPARRRDAAAGNRDEDGAEAQKADGGARRKRRRRRRRSDEGDSEASVAAEEAAADGPQDDDSPRDTSVSPEARDSREREDEPEDDSDEGDEARLEAGSDEDDELTQARRSRRRGRRGGRRRRRKDREDDGVHAGEEGRDEAMADTSGDDEPVAEIATDDAPEDRGIAAASDVSDPATGLAEAAALSGTAASREDEQEAAFVQTVEDRPALTETPMAMPAATEADETSAGEDMPEEADRTAKTGLETGEPRAPGEEPPEMQEPPEMPAQDEAEWQTASAPAQTDAPTQGENGASDTDGEEGRPRRGWWRRPARSGEKSGASGTLEQG